MTLEELRNAPGGEGILSAIDWSQVFELANRKQAVQTPPTRLT